MKILSNLDGLVDKLERGINAGAIAGLTKDAVNLADGIRDEIPKRSGELASTVRVIPAKMEGDKITAAVTIGDKEHPYAHAVWKGIPESDGQIQRASGDGWMVFEDWPGGPDELRWADGKFHFKRVKHHVPANNYIERSLVRWKAVTKNVKLQILKVVREK